MSETELRNMIMNFRVSDLQVLLGFAGRNKTGKKQELQSRALDLVRLHSPAVEMKIQELNNRRYHNQLLPRPNNYEALADRPLHYDPVINNNYGVRPLPSRNLSMNQVPNYPSRGFNMPYTAESPRPEADVRFRDLPFYDILHVVLRPTTLIADPGDRGHENLYNFRLTPEVAHDISVSRDVTGNYECHLLLRFCVLEPGTEQDDNFPPSIVIKVNDKPVQLPNPIPTNRPGVEPKRPSKPVNITSYTKLSPTVTNNVSISWTPPYDRSYAFVIYAAKQLNSYILLQRLRNRSVHKPENTRRMIQDKLQQGQDTEISTTSLRGSLICPLGKIKLELPSRALTCSHIQCFDAALYLQMNEKKPKWVCPVCDKTALFSTLVVDGLFMEIISQVPKDCTEVQFNDDGSWTPILPVKEKKPEVEKIKKSSPKKSVEVVDVSSDSDTDDFWTGNTSDKPANVFIIENSPPVMVIPNDESPVVPYAENDVGPYIPPTAPYPLPSSIASNCQLLSDPVSICPTSNVPTLNPSDSEILSVTTPQSDLSAPNGTILSSAYPPDYCSTSDLSYTAPVSDSAFQGQLSNSNENRNSEPYFDFFSLLNLPESEQQKFENASKDSNEKEPDIISLD